MITKAQHIEWGTWWGEPTEAPQSVLDARKAHGLGPNGEEDYVPPAPAVVAEEPGNVVRISPRATSSSRKNRRI